MLFYIYIVRMDGWMMSARFPHADAPNCFQGFWQLAMMLTGSGFTSGGLVDG